MSRGAGFDISYPSYSAAATVTLAASATDFFTIIGGATKNVCVTELAVSGTCTTAGMVIFFLVKRSADNTGGTSTTPTNVPLDSLNPAAEAVVKAYTANPAGLGTLVGNVQITLLQLTLVTGGSLIPEPQSIFRSHPPMQPIVLHGATELLGINLNGVTVAGGVVRVTFKWFEF